MFETERGELGDYEVFVVAADGSRLSNLTHSWADDVAPVWSPDGRYLVFDYRLFEGEEIRSGVKILDLEKARISELVNAGSRPAWMMIE